MAIGISGSNIFSLSLSTNSHKAKTIGGTSCHLLALSLSKSCCGPFATWSDFCAPVRPNSGSAREPSTTLDDRPCAADSPLFVPSPQSLREEESDEKLFLWIERIPRAVVPLIDRSEL
jgi:hypothetical protein